jgi:sensor domain CHASE-containing protein
MEFPAVNPRVVKRHGRWYVIQSIPAAGDFQQSEIQYFHFEAWVHAMEFARRLAGTIYQGIVAHVQNSKVN